MRKMLLLSASLPLIALAGSAWADNPNVPPSSPYAIFGPPPAPAAVRTSPAQALRPSYGGAASPFAAPAAYLPEGAPLGVDARSQWSLAPLSDGMTGDYWRDI